MEYSFHSVNFPYSYTIIQSANSSLMLLSTLIQLAEFYLWGEEGGVVPAKYNSVAFIFVTLS